MNARLFFLLLLALPLGACGHDFGGSVAGKECKVIERPEYAVRGLRRYDQDWIDSTVEGAVGACHWQRPAPRPAFLDAPPSPPRLRAIPPPKKRGLLKRIRDRVMPAARPDAQVAPVLEPQPLPDVSAAPPAEPETPPPPSKPRSAIDELLHPSR